MVVIDGKFDGKNIVLDKIPDGIKPNTPVRVIVDPASDPAGLDPIIGILKDADLPTDFAAQHEHYTKGTPKR